MLQSLRLVVSRHVLCADHYWMKRQRSLSPIVSHSRSNTTSTATTNLSQQDRPSPNLRGRTNPSSSATAALPRGSNSSAAASSSGFTELRARSRPRPSLSLSSKNRMPTNGRGGNKSQPAGAAKRPKPSTRPTVKGNNKVNAFVTVPGPVYDRAYIIADFARLGGRGAVDSKYLNNPKSIVSNYCIQLSGSAQYTVKKLMIDGKPLQRATIIADPEPPPPPRAFNTPSLPQTIEPIVGTGDAATVKEAEKLAALHACIQLSARGLFTTSNLPLPARLAFVNAAANDVGSSKGPSGTTTPQQAVDGFSVALESGQIVNLEQARGFMDFYCQKFGFGRPDLQYVRMNNKKSFNGPKGEGWQAILRVQGSKIGVAESKSKKDAVNRAYLDFARHLDSNDPTLWPLWQEKQRSNLVAKGHLAAQVVFEADAETAEELSETVYEARESTLYNTAQAMLEHKKKQRLEELRKKRSDSSNSGRSESTATDAKKATGTESAGASKEAKAREQRLKEKSAELKDKLRTYQTDPRVEKMREQRQSLPVSSHASSVLAKIATSSVTVVLAATGSGKTTQIPQLVFDDWILRDDGAKCNIVCTQPRRIAAISVAERVAKERGESIGDTVGYQVRFESKPPKADGSILFCTTGLFLRRMQADLHNTSGHGFLDGVTHVCVDEVHERDVDTDLLLFVLRMLLHQRRADGKAEIRVVLMSATINPTLFTSYFADERSGRLAPIVEVPGRSFPVVEHRLDAVVEELQSLRLKQHEGGWVFNEKSVMQYLARDLVPRIAVNQHTGRPLGEIDDLDMPHPLIALMIANVLAKSEEGHVLVFLPGWEEIKAVQTLLTETIRQPLLGVNINNSKKYELHVLHSSIPIAEQQKVFEPAPKSVRRVVLSTNIAETSVTIPDVVYVIDSAKCKEKRYDPERRMSQLVSAWTGTSNLRQRAGRAGRHRPGEYYSIVSDARYDVLDIHQTVEMLRTDLADTCMHITGLELPDISVEQVLMQTIQPPELARIHAAMDSLHMVGAIDREEKLTSLGRVLLQIPVEVAIGKMCLLGSFFRCLEPVLTLAAILTNRDPFMSPIAVKDQADFRKNTFTPKDFRSDPLTTLAAYNEWELIVMRQGLNRAYDFTRENFLSFPTLQLIQKIKQHLLQSLDKAGVLELAGQGQTGANRFGRRSRNITVPPYLNANAHSLPLLSSLVAAAAAPNFAIRTSEKSLRTSQDKTCTIHPSSVNSRKNEKVAEQELDVAINEIVSSDQLYAFGEKSKTGSLANPSAGGQTFLRSTTMLDPLGYMLFGAHRLAVTDRGLECDNWLPIVGNVAALDDVERLKDVLDLSLLRVFEGLGVRLGKDRKNVAAPRSTNGGGRDAREEEHEDEEGEGEAEQEAYDGQPLSTTEIADLDLLTRQVVKILNRSAEARLSRTAASVRGESRPESPAMTTGPLGSRGGSIRTGSSSRNSPAESPAHSRPASSHGYHSSSQNDHSGGRHNRGLQIGGSTTSKYTQSGGAGNNGALASEKDWRRR